MASIRLGGDSAVLSLGGVDLHASIVEPAGAEFSQQAVDLQPPQRPSPGLRKLMAELSGPNHAGSARIVVMLALDAASAAPGRPRSSSA